jgi:glycolate oxidase FAD binding subunit
VTDFCPRDPGELRDLVAGAVAEGRALELIGHGSKRPLGRPLQLPDKLDLSALSGIRDYDPSELVLTAAAATPLAEIEAALAAEDQLLAFEPPDWARLWGGASGAQTLGGIVACNLAGPRRVKAGAARDHFLGFAAVSGRGEAFKAGGRVVKNVTGYDLCKLMAGSYGTLAALTEITVRVTPSPEKTRTVLVFGLDDKAAVKALAGALNSPHEVSGAAHLPAAIAARSAIGYVAGAGAAATAIRVEGFGPSVQYRCSALREELGVLGETEELHGHNSAVLWREIGDAAFFAGERERVLWRVSVPPMSGPTFAEAVRSLDPTMYYDWGGGLVWLAVAGAEDGGERVVRAAVRNSGGGHATLVRAPDALRASLPVFEPQPPALAALAARVKAAFDPKGILNPGRMVEGA